jgi:hypothetical protein
MAEKILKIGKFGNERLIKNSLNRLKSQTLKTNSIKSFLVLQNNLVTIRNGICFLKFIVFSIIYVLLNFFFEQKGMKMIILK